MEAVVEGEEKIDLPAEMCAGASKMTGVTGDVGRRVPPDLSDRHMGSKYFTEVDALAAKNGDVDAIDGSIIRRPPGGRFDLKSDEISLKAGTGEVYHVEFLNRLNIPDLHPAPCDCR